MERGLFGFILKYSKRDQLLIVPLVVLSMLFYYASLDLPKTIINQPIQGKGFPSPESTAHFCGSGFRCPTFSVVPVSRSPKVLHSSARRIWWRSP